MEQPDYTDLENGRDVIIAFMDGDPDKLAERVRHLESVAVPISMSIEGRFQDAFYSSYIHPETDLRIGSVILNGKPFRIDDETIPNLFAEQFQEQSVNHEINSESLSDMAMYVSLVVNSVQATVNKYFRTDGKPKHTRADLLADIIALDDEDDIAPHNSIADFKGVAECFEIAAVAHNCLKIAGVNSQLVFGKLKQHVEGMEDSTESHVFIMFTTPSGKRYLFDPANPGTCVDGNGQFAGYKATLKLTESIDVGDEIVYSLRYGQRDDPDSFDAGIELTYTVGLN